MNKKIKSIWCKCDSSNEANFISDLTIDQSDQEVQVLRFRDGSLRPLRLCLQLCLTLLSRYFLQDHSDLLLTFFFLQHFEVQLQNPTWAVGWAFWLRRTFFRSPMPVWFAAFWFDQGEFRPVQQCHLDTERPTIHHSFFCHGRIWASARWNFEFDCKGFSLLRVERWRTTFFSFSNDCLTTTDKWLKNVNLIKSRWEFWWTNLTENTVCRTFLVSPKVVWLECFFILFGVKPVKVWKTNKNAEKFLFISIRIILVWTD